MRLRCSINPKKPEQHRKCRPDKHMFARRWPLAQKSPGSATQHRRGNPTASNLCPDPGSPHSPSSYTTLPAQMVYFTFP